MSPSEWGVDVEVEGIKELNKGFRNADKAMKDGLRTKLKKVGEVVQREVQKQARAKGLVDKGSLVRKVSISASPRAVRIRAMAKKKSKKYPKGYNYPKMYEYGGAERRSGPSKKGGAWDTSVRNRSKAASAKGLRYGKTAHTGSRAFMAPALARTRDTASRELARVLDDAKREFGSG